MTGDAFLSTGEAAKALGISRSTVSRRFDEGALSGKAHPITGERLISAESIERFLAKYVRPATVSPKLTRHIVVRSDMQDLLSLVGSAAAADRRIKVEVAARGSDALILCARQPTDLLILDDTATDIACPDLIRSVRGLHDRRKLAVLCCARVSDPQEGTFQGADAVLSMKELRSDTLTAHLHELLHPASRERDNRVAPVEHRRQWSRHTLKAPATIGVYRVRTPEEQSWGSVIVDNISLGGAWLTNVKVDSNSLPAESFRMLLRINTALLQDFQAHCQVLRLKVNGEVTAGVRFLQMPQECRDKILAFERTRGPLTSETVSA